MVLVFTHLDTSDHQREFQLGVIVVADNKYAGELTPSAPVLETPRNLSVDIVDRIAQLTTPKRQEHHSCCLGVSLAMLCKAA